MKGWHKVNIGNNNIKNQNVLKVTRKSSFLEYVTQTDGSKIEKTMYSIGFTTPRPDDDQDIQRLYEGDTMSGFAYVTEDVNVWNSYTLGQLYTVGLNVLTGTDHTEWNRVFEVTKTQVDAIPLQLAHAGSSTR